jgi:hypothetical protein
LRLLLKTAQVHKNNPFYKGYVKAVTCNRSSSRKSYAKVRYRTLAENVNRNSCQVHNVENGFIWDIYRIIALLSRTGICQTRRLIELRFSLLLAAKMPVCLAKEEVQIRLFRIETRRRFQVLLRLGVIALLHVELA